MRALDALEAQRGHLFGWVPVMLAAGIGGYFALPREPSALLWAALGAGALLAGLAVRLSGERRAPLFLALALTCAGSLLAGARVHLVAEPVLTYRFYGAVQGRVVGIDRSASDAPRLTLDRVWMERHAPDRTPARIRVSLHGAQGFIVPEPGMLVALTAHLSPPPAPSEPGGFNFQRRAWFERLGAVGYTRTPVLAMAPAEAGRGGLLIHRARMAISAAIRARMPGDEGAFAAAILTGDRSAMSAPMLQALRDANLAHLLAISGLHMGLLTGFVFAALRYGLSLIPPLALRLPVKKLAALMAIVAAGVYLALSGGNIATQRAFIMVLVMLLAVLFDRRALTLRAVAMAALIVLVLQPESLTEPGFQMSFAATTALVAVFGAARDWPETRPRPPGWARPVLAVFISSAVAGAATAPIGAAHFNQIAQYGLLANVLTVPLMGALVIPAAVLAAVLAPFGLSFVGLEIMRLGIIWILGMAAFVAGLDGATWPVVTPMAPVLPLMAAGMLWLILWQGRARLAGLLPVVAALFLWGQTERPALLISESGALLGVMGEAGRALNKPTGEGFVARSWLENDGDAALQDDAFARSGFSGEKGMIHAEISGRSFVQLSGRGWADRLEPACARRGWVILARKLDGALPKGCVFLDQRALARTGAIAVFEGKDGPILIGAKHRAGRRPWTR
ncbi:MULTISPECIES: ComEC/Rec2 family competence protein [Actibacterium]|uniref:Competence protein ComEC n=1 Tax=Actibacterium naphthalenivorans TaxID=1614693 RepID=A0A840CLB5_9RHOB|nr:MULTISPECIES: ComEC/Rec2 family competence protein [Actibacterium]ALG90560.1 competence protein [Actibacterium sp. EMB200-NS6]MBB4023526.1 competence protein ComEC [Actibacterium naphthalenivorans]